MGERASAALFPPPFVPQGDSWRPLGRRSGRVALGTAAGAVATIEATWVPLMHGTLPVPALRIQEIRYQVRDPRCPLASSLTNVLYYLLLTSLSNKFGAGQGIVLHAATQRAHGIFSCWGIRTFGTGVHAARGRPRILNLR